MRRPWKKWERGCHLKTTWPTTLRSVPKFLSQKNPFITYFNRKAYRISSHFQVNTNYVNSNIVNDKTAISRKPLEIKTWDWCQNLCLKKFLMWLIFDLSNIFTPSWCYVHFCPFLAELLMSSQCVRPGGQASVRKLLLVIALKSTCLDISSWNCMWSFYT